LKFRFHPTPHVFDWIEIWTLGWPIWQHRVHLGQRSAGVQSHMRSGIVLHEGPPLPTKQLPSLGHVDCPTQVGVAPLVQLSFDKVKFGLPLPTDPHTINLKAFVSYVHRVYFPWAPTSPGVVSFHPKGLQITFHQSRVLTATCFWSGIWQRPSFGLGSSC